MLRPLDLNKRNINYAKQAQCIASDCRTLMRLIPLELDKLHKLSVLNGVIELNKLISAFQEQCSELIPSWESGGWKKKNACGSFLWGQLNAYVFNFMSITFQYSHNAEPSVHLFSFEDINLSYIGNSCAQRNTVGR